MFNYISMPPQVTTTEMEGKDIKKSSSASPSDDSS